ncbi:hypothetical protein Tco_1307327, partial [Tanacetum coccineum]
MIKKLKAMFEKQAGVERFDLIQTFHACKQEEGKPVAAYVIQLIGYLAELLKKKKQVGSTNSSGKMIRKSFPHRPERATDLLRIIHTDVCGPL